MHLRKLWRRDTANFKLKVQVCRPPLKSTTHVMPLNQLGQLNLSSGAVRSPQTSRPARAAKQRKSARMLHPQRVQPLIHPYIGGGLKQATAQKQGKLV